MIGAPGFWYDPSARLLPALLSPLGAITARITARRMRRPGWRASVPVMCCGNIGVGGAGKTTLALDLLQRLSGRGIEAHALTRGYGGSARGVVRVDLDRHDAGQVGDEALLLAAIAPTWVCADRAASARAAIAQGAQCLVLDDGMQNPGLAKDCTLLVIDGASGFGNQRCLPAGPLRETVRAGAARATAAVLIGEDRHGCAALLDPDLPVLRADLLTAPGAEALRGRPISAFAGIGRPEKFFSSLEAAGLDLVERTGFADHHPYSGAELERLASRADTLGATLVTTPKDAVRLPTSFRPLVRIIGVQLHWSDKDRLERILDKFGDSAATIKRPGLSN